MPLERELGSVRPGPGATRFEQPPRGREDHPGPSSLVAKQGHLLERLHLCLRRPRPGPGGTVPRGGEHQDRPRVRPPHTARHVLFVGHPHGHRCASPRPWREAARRAPPEAMGLSEVGCSSRREGAATENPAGAREAMRGDDGRPLNGKGCGRDQETSLTCPPGKAGAGTGADRGRAIGASGSAQAVRLAIHR